jgi:hypothetical protein
MRDKKAEPGVTHDPLAPTSRPSKQKYRAPRLVEYGDLRRIVKSKGGGLGDGKGALATKLSGKG